MAHSIYLATIALSSANVDQAHTDFLLANPSHGELRRNLRYRSRYQSSCQTIDGPDHLAPAGKACVFPFTHAGTTYNKCTTAHNNGIAWCSISSQHQIHQWGYCAPDCPGYKQKNPKPVAPYPLPDPATNYPTRYPTSYPTRKQTAAPSKAATTPPTLKPAKPPTQAPTKPPTTAATPAATVPPTKPPTTAATPAATVPPTKPPTNEPTQLPTLSPTQPPTEPPTNEDEDEVEDGGEELPSHPCDDGSNTCAKASDGGLCVKDGSSSYVCQCSEGFQCMSGCQKSIESDEGDESATSGGLDGLIPMRHLQQKERHICKAWEE